MLDPVKLRVLRSVVETGSIRASAEALGYTPSAVSQHLSALRRATGLELVERTGRGITVTAHAKILADGAGVALDALNALERTAKDLRSGRTGTLRLGYATSIASSWIPELARDVRRRYPDLGLELVLRDCSCEDLAEAGMDVIVGEGTADAVPEDWAVQDVLEEGYVALVARDHPLAAQSSLPLKDLADQSWATDDPIESFWFDRIGAACRAAGFSPCVEVNPDDFATVLGFVATGDYVSVQPSVIAQDLRSDIVAIPLDPPAPRRRLRIQVRHAVAHNPAAQYIVQRIHAAAERRAAEIPGAVHLGTGAVRPPRRIAGDQAEAPAAPRPVVPAVRLPGVSAV
ncbi:LysR family transcriptional regulator [Brachybacterium fresconis]|uniref:DNA-binding transcriptional LysR family regulator n=1 Tax=Brachybacterium fresconis TaxID=173363 RepID=A0ABS4YKU5_9MICO|nr:LysR family transcriptional regulator [Brachybacterium fresconis]MBP2409426.1 DNA-binding transcriptional LysR family regulator [Brachybacterium fresconis]